MKKDGWIIRRRVMFCALAFCKGVIVYVLAFNLQSSSAEIAVNMAFIIIGTIVSSYVFGAAWEDINVRKTKAFMKRPRAQNNRIDEDVYFE